MTEKTSPAFDLCTTKRLHSGDRIWIATDIETYRASYLAYSTPQLWHKVGALDLNGFCWRFFTFGLDDARAMLRLGLGAPPWTAPAPYGIEVKRLPHQGACEGRFEVTMTAVDMDPTLLSLVPEARRRFRREGFCPNATVEMWAKLEASVAIEKAVEAAALAMEGKFSAGDIKALIGKNVNVSRHLKRMVEDEVLVRSGEKRGARYEIAPPPQDLARVDWGG
jgi:hypothetical protein